MASSTLGADDTRSVGLARERQDGCAWRYFNNHCWVLAVVILAVLAGLAVWSMQQAAQPHQAGIRLRNTGGRAVMTWVQPGGIGWDAGLRPGMVVAGANGQSFSPPVTPRDFAIIERATTLQVQPAGSATAHLVTLAKRLPRRRQMNFLIIGTVCAAVGGVALVLGTQLLSALAMFGFGVSSAVLLFAAIGTYAGNPAALILDYVALVSFGASILLVFLVFPVNRLQTRLGRLTAASALVIATGLVASYAWVVIAAPLAYTWLKPVTFVVIALDCLTALGLAAAAAWHPPVGQAAARGALLLVVLGMAAGVIPFCLLALVPDILGLGYIVQPDIAILSLVLAPVSLGVAVLSHRFFGITRLVRRGLLALVVWSVLIGSYSLVAVLVARGHAGWAQLSGDVATLSILGIALVGATFWPLQRRLRRTLEQSLLDDVYDYSRTLLRLSATVAHRHDLGEVAAYLLQQLGETLDLSWAMIILTAQEAAAYRWDPDRGTSDAFARAQTAAGYREPLVTDDRQIGELVLGPKRHELELSAEDVAFIQTLSPLLAAVLENARLVQQLASQVRTLRTREEELAALNQRLMAVQEEERRRLACDLHDDPLQRAILLARDLNSGAATPERQYWREATEEIVTSLRATAQALRPPLLDDLGLATALEGLLNDLRARSEFACTLTIDPKDNWRSVEPTLALALYRVAQEGLNNCLKHAQATQVAMTLTKRGDTLSLAIEDNGRGLVADRERDEAGRPLGLLGMQERLQRWDGVITLGPRASGGARLLAQVPYRGRSG